MECAVIKPFVVAAMLALPAGIGAQLPVNFGIAAGPNFTTGSENTGWHAGGFVGFDVPIFPVGLRLDAMMNQWTVETDADDESLRIFAVSGNIIYGLLPTPIVKPYVTGGLGFYSSKVSIEGATGTSDIGFNVGTGVRFKAASVGFFAEARYHRLFDDADTDFIPVSLGLMF